MGFFENIKTLADTYKVQFLGIVAAVAAFSLVIAALKLIVFPSKETKAESKDKFLTILVGVIIAYAATAIVTLVIGTMNF